MRKVNIFIFLIILIFSPISVIQNNFTSNLTSERTSINQLSINGNTDFLSIAKAYGWSGNGTQSSPIKLSHLDYSFPLKLVIQNTDLYFEMSHNNILSNDDLTLTFLNVTNGMFTNNSFSFNQLDLNVNSVITFSDCKNFSVFGNIFNFTVKNELENHGFLHVLSEVYRMNQTNIIFENNTFVSTGIEVYYSQNVMFDNNILTNTKNSELYGLHVWDSDLITITNNLIYDNFGGIELWGSFNVIINNNRIFNNSDSGISIDNFSNENTVKFNEIYQNSGDGLEVLSNSNIIANNTILKNHGFGISLWDGINNQIVNNSIIDNGKEGLFLLNVTNNIVKDNSIYNNNLNNEKPNSFNQLILYGAILGIIGCVILLVVKINSTKKNI